MFRIRDPQESLWQSQFLVTPKKAKRLERSWAEVFRNEALPLIDEDRFAPMYCVDNGRPNRAVQTVLGVHLLKEMFNLTDDEALEQLEFNPSASSGQALLWHHALRLDIEETHLPQKTLHNFRVRLMQHDGGRLAFQETTTRTPARGRVGDAFRSVPGTSTGWWTGSMARLLPSWRSTCRWSGCCGGPAAPPAGTDSCPPALSPRPWRNRRASSCCTPGWNGQKYTVLPGGNKPGFPATP